ncbi:hypothetical protein GPJ56_001866 [Histomonas meleagridis]|uniref:uncharacterized protein n=1 Tax=Histomonas meleagridis TaxID=135588 RepID=UPI00355A4453|nr:hypothetical protein GPJ56_001866 [Histomonas meleagridis]KAH0803195.1 hypothetical protein GO595_003931 [Histomonas meleagridis]
MLGLLLVTLQCKELAENQLFPIERKRCAVNLNGYDYSLVSMGEKRGVDTFQVHSEGYKYYIKMCNEINATADKLRNFDPKLDTRDVLVARCNNDGTSCQNLVTMNAFDWKFKYSDRTQGIIYFAQGEPFFNPEINDYSTFDIEIEVTCNSKAGPTAPVTYSYDNSNPKETHLIMSIANSNGCGTKADHVPTPSPQPYEPHCIYTNRQNESIQGVDIHLKELNGGPYGIRVPISIGTTHDQVLFFQPCERIECPIGYKCYDNLSSAWLCDPDIKICHSYGEGTSEMYMSPLDETLTTINLKLYHQTEKVSTNVAFKCSNTYPEDHILFETHGNIDGRNTLQLSASNKMFCLQPLPDPHPYEGKCHFNETVGDAFIHVDLADYNLNDNVGHKTNVVIKNHTGTYVVDGTLMYEPCNNIYCPKDTDCDGDEDATVFLCTKDQQGKQECIGYGLFHNDIAIKFKSLVDIEQGLSVEYFGDLDRIAFVDWKCDRTLNPGVITLPTEVDIVDSKTIRFEVYSSESCAQGHPEPEKQWHPPIPSKPSKPTPYPQPSPNPVDLHIINETHYIISELSDYYQPIYKGFHTIVSGTLQGTVYVEYHPWDLIPCPIGYVCGNGATSSNLWICWEEDNNTNYCHNAGDKRIFNHMQPFDNPDLGVYLHYGGVYDLSSEIRVDCDPNEETDKITFDHATGLRYSHSLAGPEFYVYTDSGAICPRKFILPEVPQAPTTPTPTPDPSYVQIFSYVEESNNKYVYLDLNNFSDYQEEIALGYGSNYQKNTIIFNPVTPKSPPTGYISLDGDSATANVWRCFQASDLKKYCHSIGNARYGIYHELAEESNFDSGIAVNYEGGYGGYETHFIFQCNLSIPSDQVNFDQAARLTPQKVVVIFAHTSMVCPKEGQWVGPDQKSARVSGGAVFLIIIFIGVVLYFSVFVILGVVRENKVEFPHYTFWKEVGCCIATGAIFLATCGKRRSINVDYSQI